MSTLKDDVDLIVLLSGSSGCSLDTSPKKNWVEKSGGLPNYICVVAKGVMKSGKTRSSAIAIAVSRIKVWAAGGDDVDADTRAKAVKALAQWEALKGKNKAKKVVKASVPGTEDSYVMLTNVGSFNTNIVQNAWSNVQQKLRATAREQARAEGKDPYDYDIPYSYIKELWTDFVLVQVGDYDTQSFVKIPYTVDGGEVEFGDPIEVKQAYVEVSSDTMTQNELDLLGDLLKDPEPDTAAGRIALAAKNLGV